MIDTVVLRSPFLNDDVISKIESFCEKKQCFDCSTGEMKYEFTTAAFKNSYDHRISVKVQKNQWVRQNGVTRKHECGSYVRVETSVHKQMLGHNVYGGSSDFQACVRWLIINLKAIMMVDLPDSNEWLCERIDVADAWNLGSQEAVWEWFTLMNNAEFARRTKEIGRFGYTGIYVSGASTTLKCYHKGTEFKKHDMPRVRKYMGDEKALYLQAIANCLLRIEVEIKIRKLKYDFGYIPTVADISDDYLISVYENELSKFMKGAQEGMKTVRKAKDVTTVLYEKFKPELAGVLLGTWYKISAQGEAEVRKMMSKATFQRHKKLLLEAGVTWVGTDVVICESKCPADFMPLKSDRHYFGQCLDVVQEMLDIAKVA